MSDDLGRGAVDDGEGAEGAGGEPGGGRFHRDGAGEGAGDRLGGDAVGGGGVAGAGDGAGAGRLGEGDDGGVVGGDGVAGGVLIVAVRIRVAPEARSVVEPVSEIWVGRAGDDGERAEGAGGEPGGGGFHRDRAGERAGDRLGRDACAAVALPVPGDGARAGGLGEGDDGRVVGGDGVAGGVLDRRGQDAGRAGGEIGGRAGEDDVGGRAVDDGEGPSVPEVSPAEVASIVTEPARTPVIVLVATPAEAVALPVPLTVPAPVCLAKVTTVELSEVTVLPAASRIVAVSTRVAPEVRSVVEPVRTMSAAAPWTTVKAPSVPVVSPAAVASIVTEPARTPVIVLVATPVGGGGVAGAADGAGAGRLARRRRRSCCRR